jgi:dipeptidyl aminopeptidase/acylaminoacyl peptidase
MGGWLAWAVLLAGCGTVRSPDAGGGEPIAERGPQLVASHVQVQLRPLGSVINNGLRLPVASPDGRYLAVLSDASPVGAGDAGDAAAAPGEAGRSPAMSLRIVSLGAEAMRALDAPAPQRADWPGWSGDGSVLAFAAGGGRLGVWRAGQETVRRMDLSVGPVEMLAVDEDGSIVAAVAARTGRLCVIDIASGQVRTSPADANDRFVAPQWTPDGRVIVLRLRAGRTSVCQYEPQRDRLMRLADLPLYASRRAAEVAMAPIARALSPDGGRLAWYDRTRDRISIVDLTGRGERLLDRGLRAGCWLDATRFVAAGDGRLVLCDGVSSPVSLMRGDWLPRRAVEGGGLICLSRGRHPGEFELSRLMLRSVQRR